MTKSPLTDLSAAQLVAIYNHYADKPLNRFASRETGVKRLTALLATANIDHNDAVLAADPDAAVADQESRGMLENVPISNEKFEAYQPSTAVQTTPMIDDAFVRDVSFRVEGLPAAAGALTWARQLAKKLKLPIEVYSNDGKWLATVDETHLKAHKLRQKAPRKAKAASAGPKPHLLKAIELASRAEGVTRGELAKLTIRSQPWTQILKNAATRLGYNYATATLDADSGRGGRVAYHFTK